MKCQMVELLVISSCRR